MNTSVHKQFGFGTEAFSKFLLSFANSTLGDKCDHGHLPCMNRDMDIFLRIMEWIKFLSRVTTEWIVK